MKLKKIIIFIAITIIIVSVNRKNVLIYYNKTTNYIFSALLKYLVSKEYPNINSYSDWNKVQVLRQWASERTDRGSKSILINNNKLRNKNVWQFYWFFFLNKGGGNCTSFALGLMKLYELYGFESYRYHFGYLSQYNHVINLVKIKYNQKSILVVQDPLYDSSYLYKNKPIDFFELLKKIKRKELNNINIVQGLRKTRDYICNLSIKNDCDKSPNAEYIKLYNGYVLYKEEELNINRLKYNIDKYIIPRSVDSNNIINNNARDLMKKIIEIINE